MSYTYRDKWDHAARSLDLMSGYGPEWRWGPAKRAMFSRLLPDANILFLALGTGLDIKHWPASALQNIKTRR